MTFTSKLRGSQGLWTVGFFLLHVLESQGVRGEGCLEECSFSALTLQMGSVSCGRKTPQSGRGARPTRPPHSVAKLGLEQVHLVPVHSWSRGLVETRG